MTRKKSEQTQHDAEVRRTAQSLEKQGFEVQADVSGYKQPGIIGGFRPDVVGTKGKQTRIVEVETPKSVDSARDLKQQKAFQGAASRSKNTTFQRKVTGK